MSNKYKEKAVVRLPKGAVENIFEQNMEKGKGYMRLEMEGFVKNRVPEVTYKQVSNALKRAQDGTEKTEGILYMKGNMYYKKGNGERETITRVVKDREQLSRNDIKEILQTELEEGKSYLTGKIVSKVQKHRDVSYERAYTGIYNLTGKYEQGNFTNFLVSNKGKYFLNIGSEFEYTDKKETKQTIGTSGVMDILSITMLKGREYTIYELINMLQNVDSQLSIKKTRQLIGAVSGKVSEGKKTGKEMVFLLKQDDRYFLNTEYKGELTKDKINKGSNQYKMETYVIDKEREVTKSGDVLSHAKERISNLIKELEEVKVSEFESQDDIKDFFTILNTLKEDSK